MKIFSYDTAPDVMANDGDCGDDGASVAMCKSQTFQHKPSLQQHRKPTTVSSASDVFVSGASLLIPQFTILTHCNQKGPEQKQREPRSSKNVCLTLFEPSFFISFSDDVVDSLLRLFVHTLENILSRSCVLCSGSIADIRETVQHG